MKTRVCNVCHRETPVKKFRPFARACPKCDGKYRRCSDCNEKKPLRAFPKVKSPSYALGRLYRCET
jgi:hypothetical protein